MVGPTIRAIPLGAGRGRSLLNSKPLGLLRRYGGLVVLLIRSRIGRVVGSGISVGSPLPERVGCSAIGAEVGLFVTSDWLGLEGMAVMARAPRGRSRTASIMSPYGARTPVALRKGAVLGSISSSGGILSVVVLQVWGTGSGPRGLVARRSVEVAVSVWAAGSLRRAVRAR